MSSITQILYEIQNPKILIPIIILLLAVLIWFVKQGFKQVSTIIEKKFNKLDSIEKDLKEIKNQLNLNTKATVSLIYHQAMNEAVKWEEKGSIPLGAKKYFEEMWNFYLDLGDGRGSEPKDKIDKLKIDV